MTRDKAADKRLSEDITTLSQESEREKERFIESFFCLAGERYGARNSRAKRRLIKTVITLMDSFLSTPFFLPALRSKEMRNRFLLRDYVRQEILRENLPSTTRSRFKMFHARPLLFTTVTTKYLIEPSKTKLLRLSKTTVKNVHHVDKVAYNEVKNSHRTTDFFILVNYTRNKKQSWREKLKLRDFF
jgi:hypothetical protein